MDQYYLNVISWFFIFILNRNTFSLLVLNLSKDHFVNSFIHSFLNPLNPFLDVEVAGAYPNYIWEKRVKPRTKPHSHTWDNPFMQEKMQNPHRKEGFSGDVNQDPLAVKQERLLSYFIAACSMETTVMTFESLPS